MNRCKKSAFLASLAAVLAAGSAFAQVMPGLGNLPLYFEAEGSNDSAPQFLARTRANEVLIANDHVQIALRQVTSVQVQFSGANPQSQIHGEAELAGKINYLTGNDPAGWRTGIPTFSQVRVKNLYPGIDVIYYGNEHQLEYDFNVAPGSLPGAITMRLNGSNDISINAQGDLAVNHGDVLLRKPSIYQMVGGVRKEIAGGYKIDRANTVAFNIGKYDPTLPLVIDPILTYSSYLGGNGQEAARAVALYTNDGSIFMAGQTLATGLATTNAYQTKFQGGQFGDAFVAKFTPTSTNLNLDFLTYLGGSGDDQANGIAVDQTSGNVFVAGYTDSPNFPAVNHLAGLTNRIGGSINRAGTYFLDGFVAELSANGSSLVYSTYLGGSGEDSIQALAIDAADNAYVVGYTLSTNLPATNAVAFKLSTSTNQLFLNYLACTNTYFNCNAFIAKISPLGTNLDYCSYFGGQNFDVGTGIAVDGANNVYVCGYTDSTNFPNFNSFQTNLNSGFNISNTVSYVFDAFVAKFGPTTTRPPLLYSTFLGNTNTDQANAIAVDAQGAAYVTGFTTSTNFPNTTTNIVTTTNGTVITTNITYPVIVTRVTNNVNGLIYSTNVFLTKIVQPTPASAATIAYSVVFGGSLNDVGNGVAVDPAGNAFVTGSANSSDFPTNNTVGYLKPNKSGYDDIFITAFNTNCTQVLYSAYLGGSGNQYGYGIAVDTRSTVYVAGQTSSSDFPTTTAFPNTPIMSARTTTLNGGADAFLAIVDLAYQPVLEVAKVKPNSVKISWPDNAEVDSYVTNFALEYATNLTPTWLTVTNGPSTNQTVTTVLSTNWFLVTNLATSNNYLQSVTLPATSQSQFFRLYSTNSAN